MAYDIIGDIHGHASELKALLTKLGYSLQHGAWRHPGRMALFVGDLIDRGPEQIETVHVVRAMVDAGTAKCIMGNHELNAIGFAMTDPGRRDAFLRPHSKKNLAQHAEFLAQVGENSSLHREIIEWFRTLPPFLDLGEVRVVHAWWHQPYVDLLSQEFDPVCGWDDALLVNAHRKGSPIHAAVQEALKGLEVKLPAGAMIRDGGGHARPEVRLRWWDESIRTYRDGWIGPPHQEMTVPDEQLPPGLSLGVNGTAPVFFGHYWFEGVPAPVGPRAVCVDYSVAKGGPLVAYRWEGESELSAAGFVLSR